MNTNKKTQEKDRKVDIKLSEDLQKSLNLSNSEESIEEYTPKELEYIDKYKAMALNRMTDEEIYDLLIKYNYDQEKIERDIKEYTKLILNKGDDYSWAVIDDKKKKKLYINESKENPKFDTKEKTKGNKYNNYTYYDRNTGGYSRNKYYKSYYQEEDPQAEIVNQQNTNEATDENQNEYNNYYQGNNYYSNRGRSYTRGRGRQRGRGRGKNYSYNTRYREDYIFEKELQPNEKLNAGENLTADQTSGVNEQAQDQPIAAKLVESPSVQHTRKPSSQKSPREYEAKQSPFSKKNYEEPQVELLTKRGTENVNINPSNSDSENAIENFLSSAENKNNDREPPLKHSENFSITKPTVTTNLKNLIEDAKAEKEAEMTNESLLKGQQNKDLLNSNLGQKNVLIQENCISYNQEKPSSNKQLIPVTSYNITLNKTELPAKNKSEENYYAVQNTNFNFFSSGSASINPPQHNKNLVSSQQAHNFSFSAQQSPKFASNDYVSTNTSTSINSSYNPNKNAANTIQNNSGNLTISAASNNQNVNMNKSVPQAQQIKSDANLAAQAQNIPFNPMMSIPSIPSDINSGFAYHNASALQQGFYPMLWYYPPSIQSNANLDSSFPGMPNVGAGANSMPFVPYPMYYLNPYMFAQGENKEIENAQNISNTNQNLKSRKNNYYPANMNYPSMNENTNQQSANSQGIPYNSPYSYFTSQNPSASNMNQMMGGMNSNPNMGWNPQLNQMNMPGYDSSNYSNLKR